MHVERNLHHVRRGNGEFSTTTENNGISSDNFRNQEKNRNFENILIDGSFDNTVRNGNRNGNGNIGWYKICTFKLMLYYRNHYFIFFCILTGLGQNQQNFHNFRVGGNFYNEIANVENNQRFEGVAVNGDFYNTVTGGKRNYI